MCQAIVEDRSDLIKEIERLKQYICDLEAKRDEVNNESIIS